MKTNALPKQCILWRGGVPEAETKTDTYSVAWGVGCSPLACNQESITDSFARFGAQWFGLRAKGKRTLCPKGGHGGDTPAAGLS